MSVENIWGAEGGGDSYILEAEEDEDDLPESEQDAGKSDEYLFRLLNLEEDDYTTYALQKNFYKQNKKFPGHGKSLFESISRLDSISEVFGFKDLLLTEELVENLPPPPSEEELKQDLLMTPSEEELVEDLPPPPPKEDLLLPPPKEESVEDLPPPPPEEELQLGLLTTPPEEELVEDLPPPENVDLVDDLAFQQEIWIRFFQESTSVGPFDNMRSLEHYLSDLMRTEGQDGRNRVRNVFPTAKGIVGVSTGANDQGEGYSRKVLVGGLPPDIDEEEITASFHRFGPLAVDWPHKAESKSYFPPKGYAFLLFQEESSVQQLIDACIQDDDKLYLCVSSPTVKDKPVQIRPWRLSDADFVLDASMPLDPRKTVSVGGIPGPLKAVELAMIMDRLYGGVCYAGIDTDPELKYPNGAGRVVFSNLQSYIAAISAKIAQLHPGDTHKLDYLLTYVQLLGNS